LLTALTGGGIILRYECHSRFALPGVGPRSCRYPGRHTCVDVHSRDRMLIVAVDDNQGLYEMVRGIPQAEMTEEY
jgi:hypothetical protein